MSQRVAPYPGIPAVINGNGAVAHVMKHVCDGVIGYPITPSTEIAELFEAARADGAVNVWGRHPFFVEAEGEHSAQSGALGAALTGGHYVSNASSSQGVLYGLESHYVTVGKKVGGFVLHVAARVVSRHSLNVMAGHDDVYALLPTGYTILFGANPQEAADLAAISYRTSALSLIPVANAMDGFATSHMLTETLLPEPELLRDYLGDPAGRIHAPTVAQELLFGAKGRVAQLRAFLDRHRAQVIGPDRAALLAVLDQMAGQIEVDDAGSLVAETLDLLPAELHAQWRRQWVNAWRRGTRQRVPALVDLDDPGVTGPVQNQADFQGGAVDHLTHFAAAVPALVRQAMREYGDLTGRHYAPVQTTGCEDADLVFVGLGSVTDDVRAVLPYLRSQGLKVGVAQVTLLQPFPAEELAAALAGARAVTVLERSQDPALVRLVTQALYPLAATRPMPRLTTAFFGLGGHDLQPRHLVAAARNMAETAPRSVVYLGTQFFDDAADADGPLAALQARMREAYPETEQMALPTGPNPSLLPEGALRLRFHSVGGYGTVATGKLLTDVLAGVLGLHSKASPKYGSEKSGAPTNYYITLSPEPVLLTNAELEDVDVVLSPDHRVFAHTNPLVGLVEGGTFILQSDRDPADAWRALPASARATIRERHIRFLTLDAFAVARKHAPSAELQTRMMGMAFIGATLGHVEQITSGGSEEALRAKVRDQLQAKFGRKGAAVVEGNLAVIVDGMAATRPVPYERPALQAVEAEQAPLVRTGAELSAAMCPFASTAHPSGLFDPAYYEDIAARPFREGTIGEAPVMPGAGLFMPPGSAANKDKGLFRLTVPRFDPTACTGCLECALACPDAAIPVTVHEVHDLIAHGIERADLTDDRREELRAQVPTLAQGVREIYRRGRTDRPFTAILTEAAVALTADAPQLARPLDRLVAALEAFPVARTRPFFDAAEQEQPGTGGLFSAVIDPWKCTGCLQCVDVCGPGSLTGVDQDDDVLASLEGSFATLAELPASPRRFYAGAVDADGDPKRLMLDRNAYYATTGGHGACRGCGEVTAIRLVTATSRALGEQRRRAHVAELGELLAAVREKAEALRGIEPGDAVDPADPARLARLDRTAAALDAALYRYEGGPTGRGPAPTVIANATGCSSVYGSTMPFTPYLDPWVNSLFQDAQPLASGLYEGMAAKLSAEVAAVRTARLELDDAYDPAVHDRELALLSWRSFSPDEQSLMPNVLTIGGDGASYDIGFGAMSRVLAAGTPITALVLDTGAYSNTGGQSSTASFIGQDADLARVGKAHGGKGEQRKELPLLAAFHPNTFVAVTSTALHHHFLDATLQVLQYREGAAVMSVYTPCGTENGIAEDLSTARSRLAVETRMSPVFVHDPRLGSTPAERFVLDGNPDVDETWTTGTVEYVDADGQPQLLSTPMTPAEFALGEVRFRKHFHPMRPDDDAAGLPIAEYVELAEAARAGHVPFVWATDADRHLIKVACDGAIVALVEERRRYWHLLRYLAGRPQARLEADLRAELDALRAQVGEADALRDATLDDIARAMADLVTSSASPTAPFGGWGGVGGAAGGTAGAGAAAPAAPVAAGAPASNGVATSVAAPPIFLDVADQPLCNDCGTCYQELPQLFEKTTAIIDGRARTVAQMIPGALERLELTPELEKRIARVKATCDGEILR